MSYNARQKLEDNIQALRVVLAWDGISALPEEDIQILKKYSGMGALKAILYKTDEDWIGASEADKKLKLLYDELYDLLESNLTAKEYKKVIESLRNSTLSSFYTPKVIPDTIYRVLSRYMKIESLYEPSAGAGVYIESAIENLPDLRKVTAYEKDYMTAKICSAIYRSSNCMVYNSPFEESLPEEDGKYDVLASNVPFGAFGVYDPTITDPNIYKKIHAYFIAKGITKLQEGGVMAVLVTDAFLNSPTGKSARRYLFERCDLLSVVVMPDNLYKESAGTEAPSHLIVVRKNTGKTGLSGDEEKLCNSSMYDVMDINTDKKNFSYSCNDFLYDNAGYITIGQSKVGKNQYGKPAMETWWDGPIEDIAGPLEQILERDLSNRWVKNEEYEQEIEEESRAQEEKWDGSYPGTTFTVGPLIKMMEELKEAMNDVPKEHPDRPITLADIPDKVKMFLPKHQQQVIVGSEEHWDIIKNLENIIEQIPGPYGQDGVPADDKIVYLHYFHGGCDWYITERDEWGIQYQMFGYANLGDDEMAEWGYVGVPELEDSRVELALFWKPCRFGDIGKEKNTVTEVNGVYWKESRKIGDVEHIKTDEEGNIIGEQYTKPEVRVPIPDTCSVEPVKGTIIQVDGKLVQIEQVHSDGTATVVAPDIKAGRESEIMSAYIQVRNVYAQLEKEQQ